MPSKLGKHTKWLFFTFLAEFLHVGTCMSHKTWVELVREGRHLLVQAVVLLGMRLLVICLFAMLAGLPTRMLDLVLRVGPLPLVAHRRLRTTDSLLKMRMEDSRRPQHTHRVHQDFPNSQVYLLV